MKFSDLFPNPKDLNPAKMFKSRDGHPWLQSVARNVMQSQVGEKNANYLNEKVLGDVPKTTPQAGFSGLLSSAPQQDGGMQQATQATQSPQLGNLQKKSTPAQTMLEAQQMLMQLQQPTLQGGM